MFDFMFESLWNIALAFLTPNLRVAGEELTINIPRSERRLRKTA